MTTSSPFTAMASTLSTRAAAATRALSSGSHAERLRAALAAGGAMRARDLRAAAGLDCLSDVGALLKYDIARGRVKFSDGHYRLAESWDQEQDQLIREAATLLRRNGYSVRKLGVAGVEEKSHG